MTESITILFNHFRADTYTNTQQLMNAYNVVAV